MPNQLDNKSKLKSDQILIGQSTSNINIIHNQQYFPIEKQNQMRQQSQSIMQNFNIYNGQQQYHKQHNNQQLIKEHQNESYFHLQPTNQNLIHKQQYHYHQNQQQHISSRLKQLTSYAKQYKPQESFINTDSNQKSLRPRVASVSSSSSSPDSTSSRFILRSPSFSSLGINQRATISNNNTPNLSNQSQPNELVSNSRIIFSDQFQQQQEVNSFQIKDNLTSMMNSPTTLNNQLTIYSPSPTLSLTPTIAPTSTTLSPSTSFAANNSISTNDALNLGINLEQYISKRNERERSRVRNVNDAFDNLKNSLPLDSEKMSKRMSKVEILRTAIGYIKNLEEVLGYKQQHQQQQLKEPTEQQNNLMDNSIQPSCSSNNIIVTHHCQQQHLDHHVQQHHHQQQQDSINKLSSLSPLIKAEIATIELETNNSQPTTNLTSNSCLPYYHHNQQQRQQTTLMTTTTTTLSNIITNSNIDAQSSQHDVYATETTISDNNNVDIEQHSHKQINQSFHQANQIQSTSSFFSNTLPQIASLSQVDNQFISNNYYKSQQQPVGSESNIYQEEAQLEMEQNNMINNNYDDKTNFDNFGY